MNNKFLRKLHLIFLQLEWALWLLIRVADDVATDFIIADELAAA